MKSFLKNENAVSITMGYILFSGIFISFFLIIQFGITDVIVEEPSEVVMEKNFADVGNKVGTLVTEIYLIAPENGKIETSYSIPDRIAGEYYMISAEPVRDDQVISITSATSDKEVNVTLAGISPIIGIYGTTTSNNQTHGIKYVSDE
ncbi:hypothetical protein EFE42_04090 [Methanohalophilus sp. RSK]|uniref:DUF7266 family protein n=1 Tax=Methanohalophilus sp. RSK TaxID=2485783 RepID=UPI000F43B046|nr:hypothetical protein [Methanohalophilus sp. RSK]RNI14564.1 hypothetical protein EFE42_04090 [Methanohalophilus sp. RSK]